MLYRFSSLFLFYCSLCMLHVACCTLCVLDHTILWFFSVIQIRFSLSVLLYSMYVACCFGSHYKMGFCNTHSHTLTHTPVYVGQFWIGSHYLKVLLKKCLFSFLSVLLYARWRFFTKDIVEKQRHLA